MIIGATIFTAHWAYKTFAFKERINDLKELKRMVEEFHHAITIFCTQIREAEMDEREIQEKMQLAAMHNKLVSMASLNLYTKIKLRDGIQSIVGSWIVGGRVEQMQRRPDWQETEKERKALWQKFESEYEEVKRLIDREAHRIL